MDQDTQEDKNVTVCEICSDETSSPTATQLCVECGQHMCEICASYHKRMKNSSNHQVVAIGTETKPENLKLSVNYCGIHQGEVIKMYCHECNQIICVLCFAESHQSHKCASIDKTAKEFSLELEDNLKKVVDRLPEVANVLGKLEQAKSDFIEQTTKADAAIADKVREIKSLVDGHAVLLSKSLSTLKEEKINEIDFIKQDIDGFKVEVENYKCAVDELLKTGNPTKVSRVSADLLTRAKELHSVPINGKGGIFPLMDVSLSSYNLKGVLKKQRVTNVLGNVKTTPTGKEIDFSKIKDVNEILDKMEGLEMETTEESRDILVSGIPNFPVGFPETVHLYFESIRKGGGSVKAFDYNLDDGTALVTFEDAKVAAYFLELGEVTIGERKLTISLPGDQGSDSDNEEYSGGDFVYGRGAADEEIEKNINLINPTLNVSGITEDMRECALIFLENKKRGGGPIRWHEYNPDNQMLTVQFQDRTVAEILLELATFKIQGNTFSITRQRESETNKEFYKTTVAANASNVGQTNTNEPEITKKKKNRKKKPKTQANSALLPEHVTTQAQLTHLDCFSSLDLQIKTSIPGLTPIVSEVKISKKGKLKQNSSEIPIDQTRQGEIGEPKLDQEQKGQLLQKKQGQMPQSERQQSQQVQQQPQGQSGQKPLGKAQQSQKPATETKGQNKTTSQPQHGQKPPCQKQQGTPKLGQKQRGQPQEEAPPCAQS